MRNNPYIGPYPFQTGDRHLFFGREREARELSALASFEQLVLLYGRSGVGKTSLINTRLIPVLEKEGFRVLPTCRVGITLEMDVSNVFISSVLLSLGRELDITSFDLTRMTLSEFLSPYFDSQDSVLGTQQDRYNPEQHFSLLLIYQLEELFTTHHDHWQERHDFFVQLAQALKDYPALSVILSLREDYLAELDPYLPLLPGKLRARYRLEPFVPVAAVEAIRGPAICAGVPFAPGVAEHLVDELRWVKGSEGESILWPYVEPVQLQVVCTRLWEVLPDQIDVIQWEAVGQCGNIDPGLTDFYESALARVLATDGNVSERQLRNWFGEQLITPLGTRGMVMQGLDDTAGLPNAAVVMLENYRIIRADVHAGVHWYELCNDTMVDPILKSNREFIQASQQAQQARRRQLYTMGGIVAVMLMMVMIALTLWAIDSQQQAMVSRRDAEVALDVAEARIVAARATVQAQEFDPDSAKAWNELCWDGSLNGYAAELLFACEKAVELEPDDGDIRDSRGLALALTGDYAEAIEDFSLAVEHWQEQSVCEQNNVNRCDQRQEWIKALEVGRNPFKLEVLEMLRNE